MMVILPYILLYITNHLDFKLDIARISITPFQLPDCWRDLFYVATDRWALAAGWRTVEGFDFGWL